ncbi:ABC transporter permease [Dehalobacterium formicoaceticum]|uniref:ABC transporter permease n=2 Tax=Dehalobacterium formicoaceticum TaxID=51515 RepID=A0ABT1Y000_9FIRM|nr:ABC transporter permease [Dehalobacterium formicoaceticum]MCR6544189.1 ABC transporter permease [Dehalobacterium formicoaceticum]
MGLKGALTLLTSLNREVYDIILLSLYVSLTSTLIAALGAIPSGIWLGLKDFPGKKIIIRILYTFMSLPPVVVGLVVFLFISRKGPLGFLEINFTPTAMILAQICILFPIITGIVFNGTKERGEQVKLLGKTLGANRWQVLILLIHELRVNIFTAIITGYGRAVSEVGAVMIVGGNIKGHTRVMTTTIAMLQSMGQYDLAIAIGIVLLLLAFIINSILYHFQQGDS